MKLAASYRLRLQRKRLLWRARLKQRELRNVVNRTDEISPDAILAFLTVRNEKKRLPYFFEYYRKLGITHFLVVDNGSEDGSTQYLAAQPDVSLWVTQASYNESNHGMDWINGLLTRYGHKHWTLVVDVDEFFVYPFFDTRSLRALTDYLERGGIRSFSTMLLDMYPRGEIGAQSYQEGQDPLEILNWFDSGNYTIQLNPTYNNLWIQGGARQRYFFSEKPKEAPALNKIALVHWNRRYVYISSTHMLLPRGLNQVYEINRGEKCSGILLHMKLLDLMLEKTADELERQEHYKNAREYYSYQERLSTGPGLWSRHSQKYVNWRQLEALGLMSSGGWL